MYSEFAQIAELTIAPPWAAVGGSLYTGGGSLADAQVGQGKLAGIKYGNCGPAPY